MNELDQDRQIRDWDGLVGHTIKAVVASPSGPMDVAAVIVTETGCWMAIDAESGAHDEAPSVFVSFPYYGSDDVPLNQYLSAADSLHAGLINQATYQLLRAKEDAAKAESKKRKAEHLRRQLAELEGGDA
jgi:hypothetical protein